MLGPKRQKRRSSNERLLRDHPGSTMHTMRRAILGLLLSALVSGAAVAKSSAASTSVELAVRLPVIAAVTAELVDQSTVDLRHYRRALLARLLLDQGRVAVSGPQALHDALVLAAVNVALDSRTEPPAEDGPLILAQSTYTLHAVGQAYRTRPTLRAAVAALQSAAKRGETKALFRGLDESADGLEAVGRRWFPVALQAAFKAGQPARKLNLLRGLWLEREGRLEQAAKAIGRAVSEKATVASTIDLVRVLARSGDAKSAGSLAKRLSKKAPGALGTLAAVILAAADERATATFERRRGGATVAERLVQARRYARQDRVAEAEGLIHALVDTHLSEPGVFPAAAGLYLRWRRLGRLVRLLESAEALAEPPRRLVEARVASVVAAQLAGTQGTTAHALTARKISGDLSTLGRSPDLALRRFGAHAAIILAATEHDVDALTQAADRALRLELSAQTLEVIAAAWLSLGRMERAITELERGVPRLAPSKRGPLLLSLSSLELAVGAGRVDRALLRKGLSRLHAVEVTSPGLVAQRTYLQALGGRVMAWLGSAAPGVGGPGASDEAALRALLPLVDRIDPTDPRGVVVVAGATLSAGALGLALGAYDLAVGAFQIARRLELSPFMDGLVVGQVALAADDPAGAATALQGSVNAARTSTERFLAHKWRALASNRAGDLAAATQHFKIMVELWKSSKAPRRKEGRQPIALLLGGVEIAAAMPPEGATQIEAVLTATPVLAADFPHDRARIDGLLKKASPKGRSKRTKRRR